MHYSENDIDENGLLKPGLGVFLVALFFCRQILYFPIIKLASRKGRGGSGAELDLSFIQIFSAWEIVACLPAVVVLVLLFLRKPEAGASVRFLWTQLKNILLLGAVTQTAVLFYLLIVEGADSVAHLVLAIISSYLVYFIITSKRLAQIITEFPAIPKAEQ